MSNRPEPVSLPRLVAAAPQPGPHRIHDANSDYVWQFWLPIVGPTGLLLWQRLAATVTDQPTVLDLAQVGWSIGTIPSKTKISLRRIAEFKLIYDAPAPDGTDVLYVHRQIQDLSGAAIARLATRMPWIVAVHDQHRAARTVAP